MAETNSSASPSMRKAVVLLMTLGVTAVFLGMIRGFLISLFLAVVFSSLLHPLYQYLLSHLWGYRYIAALLTLSLVILVIVVPLLGLLGVVAAQAYQMSQDAAAWIKEEVQQAQQESFELPEWVPFREKIDLSSSTVLAKVGDAAGQVSKLLVQSLSAVTEHTASFLLNMFVLLYAMFYFLKEGRNVHRSLMHHLPLAEKDKERLFERAVSVVRATVKGTMVIGLIQGLLGGVAMAVLGIQGAALWGTLMAVFSVVPGIGTAIIWVPAAIYLVVTGQTGEAVALVAWCAVVIGSVDNFLRPVLVGGDTKMPDLLILVSTFGGLSVFGAVGLIVGPVIAAVFVTMWDVFGQTFERPVQQGGSEGA